MTSIGADSLGFVSLDGLIEATTVAKDRLCRACFDGDVPRRPPERSRSRKYLMERDDVHVGRSGRVGRMTRAVTPPRSFGALQPP